MFDFEWNDTVTDALFYNRVFNYPSSRAIQEYKLLSDPFICIRSKFKTSQYFVIIMSCTFIL